MRDDKLWIDHLFEKHECFTYDRYVARREIEHEGERFILLLPDYLPTFEVVHAVADGELLFLVGRDEHLH